MAARRILTLAIFGALISRAQATLEKWRAKGNASSKVLWDEWSVILHRRDWRRALARTRRSNELRQASPLPVLLPPETRARVLEQVRASVPVQVLFVLVQQQLDKYLSVLVEQLVPMEFVR